VVASCLEPAADAEGNLCFNIHLVIKWKLKRKLFVTLCKRSIPSGPTAGALLMSSRRWRDDDLRLLHRNVSSNCASAIR
jgi:hypothetical protein